MFARSITSRWYVPPSGRVVTAPPGGEMARAVPAYQGKTAQGERDDQQDSHQGGSETLSSCPQPAGAQSRTRSSRWTTSRS